MSSFKKTYNISLLYNKNTTHSIFQLFRESVVRNPNSTQAPLQLSVDSQGQYVTFDYHQSTH